MKNKLRIKGYKFIKTAIFFASLFFILNSPRSSWAQELSLSIDPPIHQIEATAPSQINSPIILTNESDQNVTYSIFLTPFRPDEDGNGQPVYDPSLIDSYKDIFERIKVIDDNRTITEITLGPKQSKNLMLSIRLSEGEPPRDYYFSVIFVSEGIEGQSRASGLGAKAGIGTNVLLSVGPKSPTQGFIEEFSVPRFLSSGPVKFSLNLSNASKHYITVNGNLIIKNVFGQTVGNVELLPVNILAGSNRLIESEGSEGSGHMVWNEKFLLGVYKADLSVALSDEGPIIRDSITFFAFPAQALILIILALGLLLGIVKRARSKTQN